ncbi:hypothetical protein E4U25_005750 [Claviceps purpurea]|nr:hypothetical protein E4U37_005263 [Claviceps purpurea]KAG6181859.1 hypothetical protein E4U36_003786 [Claviceps purpurea]KAG6232935.1 hypothetical protein E4U26_003740 [Claviceps purpurea]KAG6241668.1 hypothetical protein E4U25_005750 [Claviceps purpurea]
MAMEYPSDNDIVEDSTGVTYAEYMADHQETPNLATPHNDPTDKETSHAPTFSYTLSDDDDPGSVSSAQDPQTQSDDYASDEDDTESSQHDAAAPSTDMSPLGEEEDEVEAEVSAMASAVMIISLARHRAIMLRRRQERALGLPVGNLALQFGDLAPLPCTPEMWDLLLEEFPEEEDSLW